MAGFAVCSVFQIMFIKLLDKHAAGIYNNDAWLLLQLQRTYRKIEKRKEDM